MRHNIAIGKSRFERIWKNEAVTWEWLRERLKTPVVTPETAADYRAMGRDRQTQVKDVGGFVGGYLDGGRRSARTVRSRSVITLDYDDFDGKRLERAREALRGVNWVVHSTHKHREESWRVRIVVEGSRSMTADEYGAASRKVAERIGFEGIDRSTFEPCRLMFWPSRSADAPYLFDGGSGAGIDVDALLGEYVDWRDMSSWPMAEEEKSGVGCQVSGVGGWAGGPALPNGAAEAFATAGRYGKQEDPLGKRGLIGAFCRSYGIHEAIARFIPEVYSQCGENRYTHTGSTTHGGAWILDDNRFLYSFHGTDPVQGQLLNAWDLVRLHRFGDMDTETEIRKNPDRLPSFKAMQDLAMDDGAVKRRLVEERAGAFAGELAGASQLNSEQSEQSESSEQSDLPTANHQPPTNHHQPPTNHRQPPTNHHQPRTITEEWEERLGALKVKKDGRLESTLTAVQTVLEWHPAFSGRLRQNLFSGDIDVDGELPWTRHSPKWVNADDSALRGWLDRAYGLTGRQIIDDALINAANNRAYHPVREYLDGLEWDGVERLPHLFTRVLGAEDTELNRELSKLVFTAACRRVWEPGCKFDYMVILQGVEGTGKSSLFSLMAGQEWFSDSVVNIDGKEGMDSLSGIWIAEMGELVGMKRSEMNTVKNYVSRQSDKWRPAYKPKLEDHPRQCVLVGTTNDEYFIRGINDKNRRFPVVEIRPELREDPEGGVWKYVPKWRDQLWAEAMAYHRRGDELWLPPRFDAAIRAVQDRHNLDMANPLFAEVERFLDAWLPVDWETTMGVEARKIWWKSQNMPDEEPTVFGGYRRDTATIAEIMREMLGMEPTARDYRSVSREIGQYMKRLGKEWEYVGVRKTRLYGKQATWKRRNQQYRGGGASVLADM